MYQNLLVIMGFFVVILPSFNLNNLESMSIMSDITRSDSYISHSGRTDRYGCHNDRKRGTYHCH